MQILGSARDERLGPSKIFPGHVLFPAHAHGLLDLQKYMKASQIPPMNMSFPLFPLKFLARLLFAPTSLTASSNSSVKHLPVVVFNKHPEDKDFPTKQALGQVK